MSLYLSFVQGYKAINILFQTNEPLSQRAAEYCFVQHVK